MNWNNISELNFIDGMSERLYFIDNKDRIFIGKINKFNNIFGVTENNKKYKSDAIGWKPISDKLFPNFPDYDEKLKWNGYMFAKL